MPYPGQSVNEPIPEHLNKWNWGAFCLNWIWGIGNSTPRAFLVFIPIYGLYALFQLGKRGSQWAWKNRLWVDEEDFVRTQRNWARGALLVFALSLLIPTLIFALFFGITSIFHNNDAVQASLKILRSDPVSVSAMGEPIEFGTFITGTIKTSNASGKAALDLPISGPKCGGYAKMLATRSFGEWQVDSLIVSLECSREPRQLIN